MKGHLFMLDIVLHDIFLVENSCLVGKQKKKKGHNEQIRAVIKRALFLHIMIDNQWCASYKKKVKKRDKICHRCIFDSIILLSHTSLFQHKSIYFYLNCWKL